MAKRMGKKYFAEKKSAVSVVIRIFLLLLLLFSATFFLWSVMKYNEIMEEKEEKEAYILELNDEIDRLEIFDPETQRMTVTLDKVEFSPARNWECAFRMR